MKIKLQCNWCPDEHLREAFNRCTPLGDYRWKDMDLTLDDDYDYVAVFNSPRTDIPDPSKAILFESEPEVSWHSNQHREYIKGKSFFHIHDTRNHHNADKWYITLNYRQLLEAGRFKKDRLMSGIVSGLNQLESHRDRLAFLPYLDGIEGYDHFGRDPLPLQSYRGSLVNKEDGLCRYQYHFNAENHLQIGYFTEKIIDAILCECLCFYSGCPNIGTILDDRCFIRINLKDPAGSLATIQAAIHDHEWEKRVEIIRQVKTRLMTDMNPLNIIWKITHPREVLSAEPPGSGSRIQAARAS